MAAPRRPLERTAVARAAGSTAMAVLPSGDIVVAGEEKLELSPATPRSSRSFLHTWNSAGRLENERDLGGGLYIPFLRVREDGGLVLGGVNDARDTFVFLEVTSS